MSTREVCYRFEFPDGQSYELLLTFDEVTHRRLHAPVAPLPAWTALDFHQCGHCPLSVATTPTCPLAASLTDVVNLCGALASYAAVKVVVVSPERTVSQDTTVQRAVSSLMGLLAPTSGCPRLGFFVPMARFHLPLASPAETTYRVASMALLGQYLEARAGGDGELTLRELDEVYEGVLTLNRALVGRLRAATTMDAAVNALIILDILAQAVPRSLDDSLDRLRALFAASG